MTFFKGLPSHDIVLETGLERRRVLRALLLVRSVMMAHDIPEVFSGTVEVDETYVGGQWKNKVMVNDSGPKFVVFRYSRYAS